MLKHLDVIEWPNGLGCTPCTLEYRATKDKRDNICNPNEGDSIHDLPPELYQEYSVLDNELMTMQSNGHLGKSERY